MDLANVNTEMEFEQIAKSIKSQTNFHASYWIAGQGHMQDMYWTPSWKHINMSFFAKGEPNNNDFQRCVSIESKENYHFYDLECRRKRFYICEELWRD